MTVKPGVTIKEPATRAGSPASGPHSTNPGGPAAEKAVSNRMWTVSFVVVVGAFMTQLDSSMINIVLDPITAALHSTLATTQWLVTGYLLGLVAGLPLCSHLSKRVGVGRLWLISLVAFTACSALCAASPDTGFLIVARILQGITGGVMLPAGQTVIAQVAGRDKMGRVMSVAGTALVLAPAMGPIIGAWVLPNLGWIWLFLINVPVGAAALLLGLRVIPRGQPTAAGRFDLVGFALVGGALPLITYAVSRSGEHADLTLTSFYGPLVLGTLGLLAFVWTSRRARSPLLALPLFANRRFCAAAVLSFLVGLAEFGALVAWPLYFLTVRGYSLQTTGFAMLGFAAGSAVLPIAGRMTDRFGGGPVCLLGTVWLAAGYIPVALAGPHISFAVLELSLFVLGVGTGLTVVPTFTAAYVAVAPTEVPDAVTLVNILLRVGGAVGISLVVAVIGDPTASGAASVGSFRDAFWVLAGIVGVSFLGAGVVTLLARSEGGALLRPSSTPKRAGTTAPVLTTPAIKRAAINAVARKTVALKTVAIKNGDRG